MVIIPIKPPQIAKSRLESTKRRVTTEELARAFAKDVVAVATQVASVVGVVAVTSDSSLARELRSSGATVLAEPVRLTGDLNAVLEFAQAEVLVQHPNCGIAIVTADLATIQPQSLANFATTRAVQEVG